MSTGIKHIKDANPTKDANKAAGSDYEPVRTSKDGRKYITVRDVLESAAGRAEIRRHTEHFEQVRDTSKTASDGTTGTNGTNEKTSSKDKKQ